MSAALPPAAPPGPRVLVIDDEGVVCLSCARILGGEGHRVDCKQDPREGLEAALTDEYDVILLDLVMPELDGLELLKRVKAAGVAAEVVIITGYSTVQTAVEAMKQGAADYVGKPFTPDELRRAVRKVLERSALERENVALRRQLDARQGFEGMFGESRAMERVFALIRKVAPTAGTVLITGESGTGKEMVARALHRLSPRRDRAFLACDCSALAPALLESELFGHVKGSFTGAIAAKRGLLEVADHGTLFLDELANVSLETQAKLLRVLETRLVRRVGDTVEREVDIRLCAATHRDLTALVREGSFREDLYYRLNVIPLQLPPLRERLEDIPRLAMLFLERCRQASAAGQVQALGFTPEAMNLLGSHDWPGNVRELKNVVERMAILCDAERIEPRHLPQELRQSATRHPAGPLPHSWEDFKELKRRVQTSAIQELERRFLQEALERSGGNVSRAALEVGMQRTTFHALLRKNGLGAGPDDEEP